MKKILGLTIAALLVIVVIGGGTWAFFQDTEIAGGNILTAGTIDLVVGRSGSTNFTISPNQAFPGATGTGDYYYTLTNAGSITGTLSIALDSVVNTESIGFTQHENDSIGTPNVSGAASGGSTTTLVHSGAGWTPNAFNGKSVAVQGKGSGVIASNTADTITLATGHEFTSAPVSGDAYNIGTGTGELGAKVKLRLWLDMDEDGVFDNESDYGLYLYGGNAVTYTDSGYYAADTAWIDIDSLAGFTWATGLPEFAENDECHLYVDWQIPYGDTPDNSFQGDSVSFDLEYILTQISGS